MIEKMSKFLKDLPPKYCVDCGKEIDEQHESYLNHCDYCLRDMK